MKIMGLLLLGLDKGCHWVTEWAYLALMAIFSQKEIQHLLRDMLKTKQASCLENFNVKETNEIQTKADTYDCYYVENIKNS